VQRWLRPATPNRLYCVLCFAWQLGGVGCVGVSCCCCCCCCRRRCCCCWHAESVVGVSKLDGGAQCVGGLRRYAAAVRLQCSEEGTWGATATGKGDRLPAVPEAARGWQAPGVGVWGCATAHHFIAHHWPPAAPHSHCIRCGCRAAAGGGTNGGLLWPSCIRVRRHQPQLQQHQHARCGGATCEPCARSSSCRASYLGTPPHRCCSCC
jgi:hypothetical protein